MVDAESELSLVFRVRGRRCALPLGVVVETMRPLPIEAVAGAPSFVLGMAVIRGAAVPVVGAARLLGGGDAPAGRFVTLRAGGRLVALAVDDVLGVQPLERGAQNTLPPLLQGAGADVVDTLALLDSELLWILQGSRLLPEEASTALDGLRAAA